MPVVRQIADGQLVRRRRIAVVGKGLSVDCDTDEFQLVSIEDERGACWRVASALDDEFGANDCLFGFQREVEFRFGNGVGVGR